MSRTFRTGAKKQGATGATSTPDTRPFNPSGGYPGRKARGALCSFCDNLATDELPTGKGFRAPVCDGDWCRAELREVRGNQGSKGAQSRAAPETGEGL